MPKLREKAPKPDAHVKRAVDSILTYNWRDECADYIELWRQNGRSPSGHIWAALVEVDNWLQGTSTPADQMARASMPEQFGDDGKPQED